MAQYRYVFSPFRFGNVEVKNRIEVSPMLAVMATPDGFVTGEMSEFYQSFARGGAGIVTVGDAVVDFEYGKGHLGQLNLSDERIVGGLSTLVEAIQKYGAKASIELNHAGRWASPRVLNGKNPIGPSPIPSQAEEIAARKEGRKKVQIQEMNQDMIDQVVDNFASASYRCMRAGFEMIMLHGGHGHLLGEFVSPYSNQRTDAYGGSFENRARFVIEVLEAIRRKVGNRMAIEYRLSADELIPEGMHVEETIEFIKMIQDKIDLVHTSLGLISDSITAPHMIQPTYFPHTYNAQRAARIKKAVQIPVTCVGSIMDINEAEQLLAEGSADIVAMARAMLADPEIVNKTYFGRPNDVRPCIRCCACADRVGDFLPPRCVVNPVTGREIDYKYVQPPGKKKKVIIVGGGPAGMQASITATSRGHEVTLYEKEKELGGALRMAAAPPFKGDIKRYLDWLIRKTEQSPAEIKLSAEATARDIKAAEPDVLIVAIGAEPLISCIPGYDKPNAAWAGNVGLEKVKAGKKVIVAGAGLVGCETALHIAQQGKKVTIVDVISESEIMTDVSDMTKFALMDLLRNYGVEFKTEVKIEEITESGVRVIDKQWNRYEIPADAVVLSLGFRTPTERVKEFQGLAPEVYFIGDCSNPRNLMGAIHDAFNVTAEM